MFFEFDIAKIPQYGITLLNSNFVTSLLGAFAGAYSAYLIAIRSKKKEYLEAQVQNINTAIEIALGILNNLVSHKRVIRPICENYFKSKLSYETKETLCGQNILKANLTLIVAPAIPIEALKTLIFDKVYAVKGAIPFTTALIQSNQSLSEIHTKRNSWISSYYRDFCQGTPSITPDQYFGLRSHDQLHDQTYLSCMREMAIHTDDSIFFSKSLCERLISHAERLNTQLKKQFCTNLEVHKPNFSIPDSDGMIPDSKLYPEWANI